MSGIVVIHNLTDLWNEARPFLPIQVYLAEEKCLEQVSCQSGGRVARSPRFAQPQEENTDGKTVVHDYLEEDATGDQAEFKAGNNDPDSPAVVRSDVAGEIEIQVEKAKSRWH